MKYLIVFLSFAFSGCNDPAATNQSLADLGSKLDALQKQVATIAATQSDHNGLTEAVVKGDIEERRERLANLYSVFDTDRKQVIAYLGSVRAVHVGELVFIRDDVWQVEFVKVFTEEKPNPNEPANALKLYRPWSNELGVKFLAKAQSPSKDAGSTPEERPKIER